MRHDRVRSTNVEERIIDEGIGRNVQVSRCRSFPDPPRKIVVGTVARAEPPAPIANGLSGLTQGNAAEMGADTNHDQPLRALHAGGIRFGVAPPSVEEAYNTPTFLHRLGQQYAFAAAENQVCNAALN